MNPIRMDTRCLVSMWNFLRITCRVASVWMIANLLSIANSQSVCLPLPRLLTTMPMGGQVGTKFELTITTEHVEDASEILFSRPGISATPKKDADGTTVPNAFLVSIAPDCKPGLLDVRVTGRLGLSSARAFSVGTLLETVQSPDNTSLANAQLLSVGTVCNGVAKAKSVDHYAFEAEQGHRYILHCSARGIDSKLDPVLVVADETGRDLVVERQGDTIDFTPATSGKYLIKIHELTFRGGPDFFYRLALQELPREAAIPDFPTTRPVSTYSWPPLGLSAVASVREEEESDIQHITLPCDLEGRFYPAADVDTYEFQAKQGEVWWIEVASERLGRPTDPTLLVQKAPATDGPGTWTDVLELNDIASPIRPSSNGYAYDGPPFDGGSTDLMGKFEVAQTGKYRIQLSDLFGGTRRDPRNRYRLIVRRAQRDFALAAWGIHMELRNGDRNAISKPLALRVGSTVAMEVIAFRRDDFQEPIQLNMSGLPPGVAATGLTIPAGKTRGIVLIEAAMDAPQGLSAAKLFGTASIDGSEVTREASIAQMAWPIPDSWNEIPSPRLLEDLAVSVTTSESGPIHIAAAEDRVFEAKVGDILQVPLVVTRRGNLSGSILQMKTLGGSMEGNPMFDIPIAADQAMANINLKAVNAQPGEYTLAFYGPGVVKYQEESAKAAAPRDTAEIIVTAPVRIRVLP